jgi:hypothetical protein
VFEGGDLLGDTINIASLLQESVEEGCIAIKGYVYKNVKNKKILRLNLSIRYFLRI